MQGIVTDERGTHVKAAIVVLRKVKEPDDETDTEIATYAETNEEGRFVIQDLNPDDKYYIEIHVEHSETNFKKNKPLIKEPEPEETEGTEAQVMEKQDNLEELQAAQELTEELVSEEPEVPVMKEPEETEEPEALEMEEPEVPVMEEPEETEEPAELELEEPEEQEEPQPNDAFDEVEVEIYHLEADGLDADDEMFDAIEDPEYDLEYEQEYDPIEDNFIIDSLNSNKQINSASCNNICIHNLYFILDKSLKEKLYLYKNNIR